MGGWGVDEGGQGGCGVATSDLGGVQRGGAEGWYLWGGHVRIRRGAVRGHGGVIPVGRPRHT